VKLANSPDPVFKNVTVVGKNPLPFGADKRLGNNTTVNQYNRRSQLRP